MAAERKSESEQVRRGDRDSDEESQWELSERDKDSIVEKLAQRLEEREVVRTAAEQEAARSATERDRREPVPPLGELMVN